MAEFDFEEEFVLSPEEIKMILNVAEGNIHMVNMEEYNALLQDMYTFVADNDLSEDDVFDELECLESDGRADDEFLGDGEDGFMPDDDE